VAVTATFRVLYVFVLIHHGSRRLLHFNIAAHPTAVWTFQQLREAIGFEDGYRYLIHDRDSIFARTLDESAQSFGLRVLKSPAHSPKANAICERLIRTHPPRRDATPLQNLDIYSIRLECLDSNLGSPSAMHAQRMGQPLQSGASAHVARAGCSRSTRHEGMHRPSKTSTSPGEHLIVCARSVLRGLHHEYSRVVA